MRRLLAVRILVAVGLADIDRAAARLRRRGRPVRDRADAVPAALPRGREVRAAVGIDGQGDGHVLALGLVIVVVEALERGFLAVDVDGAALVGVHLHAGPAGGVDQRDGGLRPEAEAIRAATSRRRSSWRVPFRGRRRRLGHGRGRGGGRGGGGEQVGVRRPVPHLHRVLAELGLVLGVRADHRAGAHAQEQDDGVVLMLLAGGRLAGRVQRHHRLDGAAHLLGVDLEVRAQGRGGHEVAHVEDAALLFAAERRRHQVGDQLAGLQADGVPAGGRRGRGLGLAGGLGRAAGDYQGQDERPGKRRAER